MSYIKFRDWELRLCMEALYEAKEQLRDWDKASIKSLLYRFAANFGFPATRETLPEIYAYIFEIK